MITCDVSMKVGSFSGSVNKLLTRIAAMPDPEFTRYMPNFEKMFAVAAQYSAVECFVFVGQGGAVSALQGLFYTLGEFKTTKKVYFVATTDPDYIAFVQRQCPVEKTLVVGISSSGSNVNQLEAFFAFHAYKKLVIARRMPSALMEIVQREKIAYVESPDIGDRFAGQSELALLPAALLYMPADKIFAGVQMMYGKCRPSVRWEENPALKCALLLFLLEKEKYTDVLVPIYSKQMFGFAEFVMQMMHETVCKEGKGQTFLVLEAPEMQHHSSQRFFDGRKDIVGLFIRVEKYEHDLRVHVPKNMQDILLRMEKLSVLDNSSLTKSMESEYRGMQQRADEVQIPNMTLLIDCVTPESMGAFVALWQYIAWYSAVLRDVDPYTQPAVEASKELSFAVRKKA